MRQTYRTAGCVAGLVFLLISASQGQSLGDVARQQRENQQAKKDQAAPKVITNEDLPEHSQTDDDPAKPNQSHEPGPHRSSKSAAQWKAEIEAQKHSIAALQSQMEKLNSSIRFARNSGAYYAAQYNERQLQKQEQAQRIQDQLDQQRKRLEDMQEAARKDGFGNAVYDP
ncbi:MAG: hypothetical protein ACLP6G_07105 [Terriglobales bacterium]